MPDPAEGLVHPLRSSQEVAIARAYAIAGAVVMAKQRPQDKGTRAESAIVAWAHSNEFYRADRLTKTGVKDRGDVSLAEGVMVQVKDGYTEGKEASDFLIGKWLDALDKQVKHGKWKYAFLVHKRAGKGNPDMWRWYVDGRTFGRLAMPEYDWDTPPHPEYIPPYVQLQGYMVPQLLHNVGIYR
jgi:hypothetical protein